MTSSSMVQRPTLQTDRLRTSSPWLYAPVVRIPVLVGFHWCFSPPIHRDSAWAESWTSWVQDPLIRRRYISITAGFQRKLLGILNGGFIHIMQNFQGERIVGSLMAVGGMEIAVQDALRYGNDREAFGRPITKFKFGDTSLQSTSHRYAPPKC